jgi:hypothetical protein
MLLSILSNSKLLSVLQPAAAAGPYSPGDQSDQGARCPVITKGVRCPH